MMTQRKGMQDFNRRISAGATEIIEIEGDYFHVFESETNISISFDEGQKLKRKAHQGGSVAKYTRVSFYSEVEQSVRVSLGFGTVTDTSASAGSSSGESGAGGDVNATIKTANKIQQNDDIEVGQGAIVRVLGSNENRKEAVIVSNPENGAVVRLGTSTVNGTSGIPIDAGGTFTIHATDEVWIHNTSTIESIYMHVLETELI